MQVTLATMVNEGQCEIYHSSLSDMPSYMVGVSRAVAHKQLGPKVAACTYTATPFLIYTQLGTIGSTISRMWWILKFTAILYKYMFTSCPCSLL